MFLLSILLLFASLLSHVSGAHVEQTPGSLSVTEGDAADITCCWNSERILSFEWVKNTGPVQTERNITVKQVGQNCSSLSFRSIRHEDAGMYVCRVTSEIPTLSIVNGPGTYITVKDREPPQYEPTALPTAAITATLSLLGGLILLTVLSCRYRKRKRGDRKCEQDPVSLASKVIYEVPQTDSELAEMDKHSTSSSNGSAQWYQVVLYEAVEYLRGAPKTKTA